MQKRRLGNTGIEVSVIGLGTVKFGRNQGVKYPHAFELPTDTQISDLLSLAKELGINLLDTAPAYGSSEERLGKLLTQRHEWILTTKVGEEFNAGDSYFDFSPQATRNSIERSLQRLKTDYLDIVLVHSNGDDERIINQEGIFRILEDLKQQGKLRAYGMSTKTVAGGLLTLQHSDLAMVTFNPNYTDEREVLAYAHAKQKGIFIKKAFASGHQVADNVLRYISSEPGVTSIIVGTLNPLHLRQNASFIA